MKEGKPTRSPRPSSQFSLHTIPFVCLLSILSAPGILRADEYAQVSHYSALLAPRGLFVLDTRIGDVKIEGWDDSRVEIEAEKVVRVGSEAKAARLFKQIKIELREEDEGLSLRTVYPPRRPWRLFRGATKLSANFRIRMPRRANLRLKCVDGDVTIRGVGGHQQIRVSYGVVEVTAPSLDRLRSVNASTWLGNVQSDLGGENGAGFGRRVSFWNPTGDQNIVVRVRLGGVYIYHGE
jgi:hypothetical protein